MSDNIPPDLASSITSCATHVEEEAQRQAMWALPEIQFNGGTHEPLQQQEEDGQLQTLGQYLSACHNMSQAARTLTGDDSSSYSQASTSEPEGKLYPSKIALSPDFMDKQMEVWNLVLADDNSALLQKMFPSMEQVHDEYFSMEPINGEPKLCVFERLGVSKAVLNLLRSVLDDEVLSQAVGLTGDVTYGPLDEGDDSSVEDDESEFEEHPSFCVYSNTQCGRPFPVVGIEYKPSDPPMVQDFTTALVEDIVPERDVIGREDDYYTVVSSSKQVVTATITQLFDRMVKSGVPYGYIYTGEAIIFVEIHDDPSVAHCYVSIPDNDVSAEDESTLRYSAVSQIFAFMLRAMQAGPRSVQWHDRTATLDVWRSSSSEALLNMPSYQGAPGSSSAVSHGNEVTNDVDAEYEHVGEDDLSDQDDQDNNQADQEQNGEHAASHIDINEDTYLNIQLEWASDADFILVNRQNQEVAGQNGEEGSIDDGGHTYWFVDGDVVVSDIRQRQYCTQECLLGLTDGAPLDQACPNFEQHGHEHIDNLEFLRLVQSQLGRTRRVSACCVSLDLRGSLGAMFKVTIPSNGYTFVAKGVTERNVPRLLREADTYTRLRDVQGGCVPVYLGIVQLEVAFDHGSTAYSHFMLLSWAGRPVGNFTESQASRGFVNSTRRAYTELHSAGLVHNDAQLRNMLYNPQLDRIMLVDFEHASIYECHVAEFQYRNTSRNVPATIMEVEEEDDEAGGSGSNHIHNHTPGHSYGGGLRRVNRCENLRREFEVASERELSRAVNLMENLTPTLRQWRNV